MMMAMTSTSVVTGGLFHDRLKRPWWTPPSVGRLGRRAPPRPVPRRQVDGLSRGPLRNLAGERPATVAPPRRPPAGPSPPEHERSRQEEDGAGRHRDAP